MHSLETILSFLALLGCLGLLTQPIIAHQEEWNAKLQLMNGKWHALECSSAADAALSMYVLVQNGHCWAFPYALHPNADPLQLYLGGDSNHYAP